MNKAYFHLPGLFEFTEFYKKFLPIFYDHKEYFYDWCHIGSIYGAPADCLWGGGRVGFGQDDTADVLELVRKYNISARLTFSNSLLTQDHISDKRCNELCESFGTLDKCSRNVNTSIMDVKLKNNIQNGIIISSDILLNYIKLNYPNYYFVSSTTKVITDWDSFVAELDRQDFKYVVPDFRLNKRLDRLENLSQSQKDKVEFLCNECCFTACKDRKACYYSVSKKSLGIDDGFVCMMVGNDGGYSFSKAMENPSFISVDDIRNTYMPMGFSNFKIEGRGLGSALLLEFILYYMTKPKYQLKVREEMYLDSMLDLF